MKKFSAKEAKNEFGFLIDTAQKEPVTIEKKGRPVAVIVSLEEYQRLESIEEAWWAGKAKEAQMQGFLGTEKSENLLRRLLS